MNYSSKIIRKKNLFAVNIPEKHRLEKVEKKLSHFQFLHGPPVGIKRSDNYVRHSF